MKHLRISIATFLAIFFLTARASYSVDDGNALEYKVKAVVLFNFAKYVKWPDKTFSSQTQPIQVCLLGQSPFGDIFNSPEAPKEAQNRPLKVVELSPSASAAETAACQILFWTDQHENKAENLKAALDKNAVLSVSDNDSDSALISFVLEDGKVRFKIRHKAAKELGIEISSQLLKLAILDD